MREKIKYLIWEILFFIFEIIYLTNLYFFNLKLEKIGRQVKFIEILNKIDDKATNYFIIALLLLTCGTILIGRRIIQIKNDKYNFDKLKLNLIAILIVFILCVLTVMFIGQYVLGIIALLILGIGIKLAG